MRTIAFFGHHDAFRQATLIYHTAWAIADLDLRVLVVDFDPSAGLSTLFLDDERLEELWPDSGHPNTVFGALDACLNATEDVAPLHVEEVDDDIGLLVGDVGSGGLVGEWSLRSVTAVHRLLQQAATVYHPDVVLVHIGPGLSALDRSALLSADHVVVPVAPDLLSLQTVRSHGPIVHQWLRDWRACASEAPHHESLPTGEPELAGYVLIRHELRLDQPAHTIARWLAAIPAEYRRSFLGVEPAGELSVREDPHCLALLRPYRSLMPMAMEARKPIFHLKPADGAMGALGKAARQCGEDFRALARALVARCET
jgi:chromosome partitioning protein